MEMNVISDNDLLHSIKEGFRRERKEQVLFLKQLAEVDRRGLWKKRSCSLNEFCRKELGLSESSTWKRIQVCHLGVRLPYALELLEQNKITLTNLSILSPCLTLENGMAVLNEASGRGRYEVEAIKARFLPRPEPRDSMTPISSSGPLSSPVPETSPAKGVSKEELPLFPIETQHSETIRVRITFVADDSLVKSMNKVKALLSHKLPNARLEEIEAEVYRFYLEAHDLEMKKPKLVSETTSPTMPAKHTRYIPVEIEKEVWRRDESCCSYQYENGERCRSTYALQLDHVIPFSEGGRSDLAQNIRLLCRFHNQLEAERTLGERTMNKFRKKSGSGLNNLAGHKKQTCPRRFQAAI